MQSRIVDALAGLFLRAALPLVRAAASRKSLTTPIGEAVPPPWGFTPNRLGAETTNAEVVSQMLLWADGGFFGPLVDLFDEMRLKDAHLHAVLMTLELSISGMELRISPARDKAPDRRIAAATQDVLSEFGVTYRRDISPSDMTDLISHHVGGFVYGYSVSQTIWEKQGGDLIPIGGIPLQPRRFIVDPKTGRLCLYDAAGGQQFPGSDLYEKYPNQIMQFQPRVNGTGPMSEGLMRVLLWSAIFRNWGIRDWLQLARLAWHPYILGVVKRGGAGAGMGGISQHSGGSIAVWNDVANLEKAINDLLKYGTAVHAEATEIDVKWPQGSGGKESGHEALARFFADEMSKAALGSTLSTQQGRTGAMALGQVHDSVRKDRRNAMARAIAAMIRKDLVEPFVRMNFGANVYVPKVSLVPQDDLDLTTFSTALKALVDAGMQVPAEWVRSRIQMPSPRVGDEVLGPALLERVPAPEPSIRKLRVAQQELKRIAPVRVRLAEYITEEEEAELEYKATIEAMEERQRIRSRYFKTNG
jgi:phage gp29-like protein